MSCKKPGCPKVYHADCLNLSKRPAGEWLIFKQHESLEFNLFHYLMLLYLALKFDYDYDYDDVSFMVGSPFLPCVDVFLKEKKR